MNKQVEDFKVGMKVKAVYADAIISVGEVYTILENDGASVPLRLEVSGGRGYWVPLDWVELVEDTNTEIEPMSVDQLTAFLYGYAHAGGDVTKMVTITFEGDK